MTKEVKSECSDKWKIVLIKTIDNREPVYYRLVNMFDYTIENIPAYRLLDEIVNKKKDIVNVKCENNQVVIIDDDGYESTRDIIIVDEFDTEIQNIFDWAMQNEEMGSTIISRFDSEKNAFSPSNFKINSTEKIAWTCKNNHTIRCGFPAYFSTKGVCPICEMEESGKLPSLKYWAHMTGNLDILKAYDNAVENKEDSNEISYKARKKVWFNISDNEKDCEQEILSNVTVKGYKLGHVNMINLSKARKEKA